MAERLASEELVDLDSRIGEIDSQLDKLERKQVKLILQVSRKSPEAFARECAQEGTRLEEGLRVLNIALEEGRISTEEWREIRSKLLREKARQLLFVAEKLNNRA